MKIFKKTLLAVSVSIFFLGLNIANAAGIKIENKCMIHTADTIDVAMHVNWVKGCWGWLRVHKVNSGTNYTFTLPKDGMGCTYSVYGVNHPLTNVTLDSNGNATIIDKEMDNMCGTYIE